MRTLRFAALNLWYTIFNSETFTIFQLALQRIWQVIQQLALLLLLLTLFLSALAVWVLSFSFQSGRTLRAWLENEQPTFPQLLSKTRQLLKSILEPIWDWTKTQIETKLGVTIDLPPMPEYKQISGSGAPDSKT